MGRAVEGADARERRLGDLAGTEGTGSEAGSDLAHAHAGERLPGRGRHQRSPPSPKIDGMRKLPSCCFGAFSNATA